MGTKLPDSHLPLFFLDSEILKHVLLETFEKRSPAVLLVGKDETNLFQRPRKTVNDYVILDAPLKFNIAPAKWWLEEYFRSGWLIYFQGLC